MRLAINPERSDAAAQGLFAALVRLDGINQATPTTLPAARLARSGLSESIAHAHPASSGLRRLLTEKRRKDEARAAAETLVMVLANPALEPLKTPGAAKAITSGVATGDPRATFVVEPAAVE